MKLIYLLFIALSLPVIAQAETGAQLREDCAAFDAKSDSNLDSSDSVSSIARMAKCSSYIYGVLDVPILYEVHGADYCEPVGTNRGTALGVVREYIRRPEVAKMTWAGSGAQVVINAMMTKWPCKDARK